MSSEEIGQVLRLSTKVIKLKYWLNHTALAMSAHGGTLQVRIMQYVNFVYCKILSNSNDIVGYNV